MDRNSGRRSSARRRTCRARSSRRSAARDKLAPVRVGDAGNFRRQRPAFSDVHSGRSTRYQSMSFGRTPPSSTGYGNGQRYAPVRRAARDRLRRASDRRRTRPGAAAAIPVFTASSHSCCGGAGRRPFERRHRIAHPIRAAVESRRTAGGPSRAPARCRAQPRACRQQSEAGAGRDAKAASECRRRARRTWRWPRRRSQPDCHGSRRSPTAARNAIGTTNGSA